MSYIASGVAVAGLAQSVIGGIKKKNAQKKLENQQVPTYTPNKGISDYYQQALNRYNTSPYQSNFYQQAQKQADRGLATGIGALQDRRSAVGNIGALVQGNDDAMQRAGVQAEGMQRQDFGQLGQATGMQAGDQRQAFDTNKMLPYEQKRGLYEAQAAGGSQMENAGLSNLGGAATMYSNNQMYKQIYGLGTSGGGGGLGRGTYSSEGTGLAYTGGADINHQVNGPGMGYIDPNSYSRF
jgi:hypothetical protein